MIEPPDRLGEEGLEPVVRRSGAEAGRTDVWSAFLARHRRAMEYAASAPAMARVGLVVLVGYVVGLYVAIAVCRALPVSSASLEEARRLGILLSVTVLNGYSKSHEFTVYIISQIIVILVVVGVWWIWCVLCSSGRVLGSAVTISGSSGLAEGAGSGLGSLGRLWHPAWVKPTVIDWMVVPLVVTVIAFDMKRISTAWLGESAFLFEEGTFLSTVDGLLRGGILYRDDVTAYAPLMLYPVKWLMEAFDVSVVMLRVYAVCADILGFVILYHVLLTVLRRRMWALGGCGFFLVNYSLIGAPGVIFRPSIHESVLRFSIGLAWLPFFFTDAQPRRWNLMLTGAALGVALTFSHEVGIVACLACFVLVVAGPVWGGRFRDALRELLPLGAGLATILMPWLIYFAAHGAVGDTLYALLIYPQYYGRLAFANLPFPPPEALWWAIPRIFRWNPSIEALSIAKGYWILLIISVGAVTLAMRLAMGRLTRDDRIVLALALLAGMLFKTALSRTDIVHIQAAFVPSVVLGLILLQRFSEMLKRRTVPLVSLTAAIGMATVIISFAAVQPPLPVREAFLRSSLWPVSEKVADDTNGTRLVSDIPRARGIRLPIAFADDFEATVRYITTHTAPDERIVAFPYELAYYFYTERRSATRYASAVSAVTREDRLAMIDELERVRPRYLIYSLGTPRIDGLKDGIVFPELTAYIGRSYTPEQRFGKTWILRRREAVALPND